MFDKEITVIICTKNRKRELGNCVRSLGEQSYRNFNVIIVDQSDSGDNFIYEDIKIPGNNSIKINHIKDNSVGLSRARNIGIKESVSNYLVFVDDDGILGKDCLFEYSKYFDKYDFIAGSVLNFDKTRYNRNHGNNNVFLDNIFKVFYVSGGNFGFQKKICNKIGVFDTTLGAGERFGSSEDTDFFYRAYTNRFKGLYNSKAVCYHPLVKFDKDKITSYGFGRGAFYRKNIDVRKLLLFFVEILFHINKLIFSLLLLRRTNFKYHCYILKAELICFMMFRRQTRPIDRQGDYMRLL